MYFMVFASFFFIFRLVYYGAQTDAGGSRRGRATGALGGVRALAGCRCVWKGEACGLFLFVVAGVAASTFVYLQLLWII